MAIAIWRWLWINSLDGRDAENPGTPIQDKSLLGVRNYRWAGFSADLLHLDRAIVIGPVNGQIRLTAGLPVAAAVV
jgi:hypothetical protein